MIEYPNYINIGSGGFIRCSQHPNRIAIAVPHPIAHHTRLQNSMRIYTLKEENIPILYDYEKVRRHLTTTGMCAECAGHVLERIKEQQTAKDYGRIISLIGQYKSTEGNTVEYFSPAINKYSLMFDMLHPPEDRVLLAYLHGDSTINIVLTCALCFLGVLFDSKPFRFGIEHKILNEFQNPTPLTYVPPKYQ